MSDSLPTGWANAMLQEICDVNPRHPKDTDREQMVSFVPMPAVSDILGVIQDHELRPLNEVWKGYTHFRNGDVIFAKITPCMENGKIAVASNLHNGLACGSTEFHVLRPYDGISARLLWYFLRQKSFRKEAEHFMTGAVGQRRVPMSYLEETVYRLPPADEQCRIVAKLDSLFSRTRQAREELENIPALIEHYKQSILAAAFRGELTADWRENHQQTVSRKIDGNQDIEGDIAFEAPFTIPTGWKWIPLPKLGKLGRGKSRHRPRNEPSLYGGPYPFVQTGEIRAADGLLTTYTKTYSEIGLAQSKLWPVGTVCITIAANIAETAILGIEACFPDSVVGLVTDDAICLNKYAEYFLRTVREELDAFAPATAQKNINLGTLSEVYIPLPPRNEQDEIVRLVGELYESITAINLEAQQAYLMLDHLEQATLAKAFHGELVSQEPNDEPASILLERIREVRAEQSNDNTLKRRT